MAGDKNVWSKDVNSLNSLWESISSIIQNKAELFIGFFLKTIIIQGECLDNNEPQLVEWVKPQINHNVIGDSIENITSVTQCSEKCFDNPECRSVSIYN